MTAVKMLELIVEKVSWDGSCKVANMINNTLSICIDVHVCEMTGGCDFTLAKACSYKISICSL